jgi:hypothetical protein
VGSSSTKSTMHSESKSQEMDRFDRADNLGLSTAKVMITLNSGAIIAVLTFLGNASAQTQFSIALTHIKYSLALFLISMFAIIFGMATSYTYYASPPNGSYSKYLNKYIVPFNAVMMVVAVISFIIGVSIIISGAEITVKP